MARKPWIDPETQWTPEESAKLRRACRPSQYRSLEDFILVRTEPQLLVPSHREQRCSWIHRGRVLVDAGMSAETLAMIGRAR